jgi:hypothetical protein
MLITCLLFLLLLYLLGAIIVYKTFIQMAYCAFQIQKRSDGYYFLLRGIYYTLFWPIDFMLAPQIMLYGHISKSPKYKYNLAVYYGSKRNLKLKN